MSLSPETLYPLQTSIVEFEYCHDRPLRTLAARFVPWNQSPPDHSDRATCTLMICSGLNLQKETWLSVIKRLYQHASLPASRVTIHSVWVIERPNHGDAALLNEASLKEHYGVIFPGIQYAAAIRTFLASGFLSDVERANLIAVGHSAAGSSILRAMQPATSNLPISGYVLVESPLFDREDAWEPIKELYKAVEASNKRRKTSWSSVAEAMEYFKKRFPCKIYHPEVLQIMSVRTMTMSRRIIPERDGIHTQETYFCKDPQNPKRVTTKTTVEQETASFLDDGTHLEAFKYLRTIFEVLPTHMILGTGEDIWTPELYRQQSKNLEQYRESFASVSVIQGAGHYLPVQMPDELAAVMARLLNEFVGKSMTARL
ncbi:Alpha/beta hydrolase fold-1 [Cerioporus squamosus]|nr:Alpha/beta hydrolase fold-1 [Cerioporus squamosus]